MLSIWLAALVAAALGCGVAWSDGCEVCQVAPDTCCDVQPLFPGAEAPVFSPNVVVATREGHLAWPYVVTIYDLGSALPSPLEDKNWASVLRYHGPFNTWNADTLGTVFGLTLDKYGNIFVTHTSCYLADSIAQVFNGGPGAVYRIDANTGVVTTFCRLPNYADPGVGAQEWWPGLGNITYDCRYDQFFVTNMEDGRIYRLKATGVNGPTGTIQEVFDPFVADLGPTNYLNSTPTPGWAPYGERLWGVQRHGDRVFYGRWVEDQGSYTIATANEIRSVAIDGSGAFVGSSDQHELFVPAMPAQDWSMPVSDISFTASGKMLLGERGVQAETYPAPHMARALEYVCSGGCWVPANTYDVGAGTPENSSGGVDYDKHAFNTFSIGRVWVSGDHLQLTPDIVYGYQGFRPTGGTTLTSMLIDADTDVNSGDKTYSGDIEAPGCPNLSVGTICGQKYHDQNRNGVKDGAEPPLPGWTIVLNGPGGPYTAVTDGSGSYCFTNVPVGNYVISEAGQSGWVQTAPAGGTHALSLAGGSAVTGKDFGNYACGTGGCVSPPPGMVAWWPFNEAAGSTTAADVTHQSPPKNVAQLFNGANIATRGKVRNAICFPSELDEAKVPNANQWGLNFGAGSFAMDAWINVALTGANPRLIVEKRVLISSLPYKTRGWALYLNGMQLFLEIGNGIATQTVPGPVVSPSAWNHVAVSCDRVGGLGRWYLNGALQSGFNFTPLWGSVYSTADLYIGHVSPPFGILDAFQGCIDELQLFNQPLPAATVQKIFLADTTGKCQQWASLPQVTTICQSQTSVQVCFNICNNTAAAQSYHWSLAGLPVGPGCTVPGPTSFSVPAGAVTVAPGQCSAQICVTIPRPPGLTAQNATSCYQLSVVNDSTGACFSSTGTIRADNTCWCVTPVQTGIVYVPGRLPAGIIGIPVEIGVGHPCDPTGRLDFQISARYAGGDHDDPHALSLNGLPPGEPYIGYLDLETGGNGIVSVAVSFPNGYDPAAPYEIVLDADTDGDGVLERQCGTRVVSTYDEEETVDAPGDATFEESVRLQTAPNPFSGRSTIGFALARPSQVELGVYDLGGRLVRSLKRGMLPAGAQRFEWDGRDSRGREVAGGIYFVKLHAERVSLEAKLVKLR